MIEPPTEPLDHDPYVGQTIEKRYEILERIGKGGMGSVYRSKHINLNREFAIKLINRELCADPTAIERFRREAKALGAIQHPNAVNVSDFGLTDSGEAFLVMELLKGQILRYVIAREAPLPLPRIATILRQICGAITAAHRVGVIHRDLKPENIILVESDTQGETAKVLDFGIAKLQASEAVTGKLTSHGMVFGTPRYMSPEACQGDEQGAASDIYALGVILFELLTGRAPFEGRASKTAMEIALQHLNEPPPTPSLYRPDLPPAVDAVVLKALSKRAQDRQTTPLDLADEFDSAMYSALETMGPDTDRLPPQHDTVAERTRLTEPIVHAVDQTLEVAPPAVPVQPLVTPHTIAPQTAAIARTPGKNNAIWIAVAVTAIIAVLGGIAIVVAIMYSPSAPSDLTRTVAPWNSLPAGAVVPGMVSVAGGEFLMGETARPGPDQEREKYDAPPNTVRVGAFLLDTREVTNGDYVKFLADARYPAPPGWSPQPDSPDWVNRPVTNVTWTDADAYARWAGKRLPTEAEWEFAARGTDGRRYPWGDEWDGNCAMASQPVTSNPEAAGSHPSCASPFGALDMAGSVWEWTASNFAPYPGGPPAPKEFENAKVIRGGAWTSTPWDQRSTHRDFKLPTTRDPRLGFRCARSVAP